jgi:hypothetical protein
MIRVDVMYISCSDKCQTTDGLSPLPPLLPPREGNKIFRWFCWKVLIVSNVSTSLFVTNEM